MHAFLIAGETSGDQLAAELVHPWRRSRPDLRFSGAGGPAMAAAGVQLSIDLTAHSVIGLWEVIRRYRTFRRLFHQLLDQCVAERPDIIVGIDYGGFNLRFATALRERTQGTNWNPRIVQYVSPQVWASRPGRARRMEKTHDLLLSILPFEKDWYARHAPGLPVEFVGHPIVDRHADRSTAPRTVTPREVLLLPGSRVGELQRHLPVLLETVRRIRAHPGCADLRARLILPNARLVELARFLGAGRDGHPEPEVGGLPEALQQATLALASTGTVTLECAWFGVPTLALYRTSWLTYEIGRRVITVKHLAMPNLLADAVVMPEFIQSEANPVQLAQRAVEWLSDPAGLLATRQRLRELVSHLGTPGAAARAAGHLENLLQGAPERTPSHSVGLPT
jgi:lipid-A-disaccharide synthase